MRLSLTTAPLEEPIGLTDAKAHLRVTVDSEDVLITDWIRSARHEAERGTGRALVSQTWTGTMDCFPDSDEIVLPLPPLVSVTSVTYTDPDGDTQTFAGASYTVDTSGVHGRLYLNYGYSWPSIRVERNAVSVIFVAGYGDPVDVPEDIRSWMLLRIGQRYEHREGVVVGTIATKLPDVDSLLMGGRVSL